MWQLTCHFNCFLSKIGFPIVPATRPHRSMPTRQFLLNPMRTAKQGVNVNIGKDSDEYKEITTTLSVHASDMESLGVADCDAVLVRTEFGQAEFKCETAKVPEGMIFV